MRIILCAGKEGRAVLVGDVEEAPVAGQAVTMANARMVLEWSAACGGLLGLAAHGPKPGTRITARAELVYETVWQEWVKISEATAQEFEKWPEC